MNEQTIEQRTLELYVDDLQEVWTSEALCMATEDFPEYIAKLLLTENVDEQIDIVAEFKEAVYNHYKKHNIDHICRTILDEECGE